jgi:hypothetical protein
LKSAAVQLPLEAVEKAERKAELEAMGDAHEIRLNQLFAACKKAVRNLGSADDAALELSAMWEDRGRPVTAPVLRAALADSRGNYFRLEWILYFAELSEEVRDLLIAIGHGDTPKDPREELDDVYDVIREELGKTGEALIRKAKARRRRRR